jgi:hypothetical protein
VTFSFEIETSPIKWIPDFCHGWWDKMGTKVAVSWMICTRKGIFCVTTDVVEHKLFQFFIFWYHLGWNLNQFIQYYWVRDKITLHRLAQIP